MSVNRDLRTRRFLSRLFFRFALLVAAGGFAISAYFAFAVAPGLPSLDALTDYQPKIPLRVYTADGSLIGEFGEERRDFVAIHDLPAILRKAVLAAEDDRFYEHGGVDYLGVLRAVVTNFRLGGNIQGASTITMQVARNFFLSREKTYLRKISEVMLAYRIEDALSKDRILELYMNQIYLGQRSYGFAAAARAYFGKAPGELTLAEVAMLAGLPKAPSVSNPVVNPRRATQRQHYVLQRMRDLGFITPSEWEAAREEPLRLHAQSQTVEAGTRAEHAAELVRQIMYAQYREETYTRGFSVYTTITKRDQDAAHEAVRRGVLSYDRRNGYRGPEGYVKLPKEDEARRQVIEEALARYRSSGDIRAAVVTQVSPRAVKAEMLSGEMIEIGGEGLRFALAALSGRAGEGRNIRPGAVIRVTQDEQKRWFISQMPDVAAAFIALDARDGAYRAMVGGFDFESNKFDHVTQAWRQPGSSIKPFIYSAALEKGFFPGTKVNDAPLQLPADHGSEVWEPKNDDDRYAGPVTLRTALAKSKNVVSVRVLRDIGANYGREYLRRFGFLSEKHPANLTLALGTGSVTPLQMAGAYAVFANGGYQVQPYLIQKVIDARGNVLTEVRRENARVESARVIDRRNAFIMDSMLRDVVRSGTAQAAGQRIGREDLAGKTGTTNDSVDAWFAGYSGNTVAVAWMGYSQPKSLGSREFGSTVALPVWVSYMQTVQRGIPETVPERPADLAILDGEWIYPEYLDERGVRSVDLDGNNRSYGAGGSIFDRMIVRPGPSRNAAAADRQRALQEMYGPGQ